MEKNKTLLDRHVTFCPREQGIVQRGRQAELDVVDFLIMNLRPVTVGDYRILVNYNLSASGGASGSLEVDIVLIDMFGVFLLEVKDWHGVIEAYDDVWFLDSKYKRGNALKSVNFKASVMHSNLFGREGVLSNLGQTGVVGIVVLAQGDDRFVNKGSIDTRLVTGLDAQLLHVVSSHHLSPRLGKLDDPAIERVKDALYAQWQETEKIVGNYRLLGELSPGDLFEAYEAQHIDVSTRRVRLKVYRLPSLSHQVEADIRLFKRSAEALSALGPHRNILGTYDFFPDPGRDDVFYEVCELPQGNRLDEIIARRKQPFPYEWQVAFLEQLSSALWHAHSHRGPNGKPLPIYHRNLNPETVFITGKVVKLADFDFAKLSGQATIFVPGRVLIETCYTAPEIIDNPSAASASSDIYSLGVLWYHLARIPSSQPVFDPARPTAEVTKLSLPIPAQDLLKSMLAKEPRQRLQNLDQFRQKLRDLKKKK